MFAPAAAPVVEAVELPHVDQLVLEPVVSCRVPQVAVVPELLLERLLGEALDDGSDGLLCDGASAKADSEAVSFLPNLHQLLPEPVWQPVIPIMAERRRANRALEMRIAMHLVQRSGKGECRRERASLPRAARPLP
jgi:hypothetical protein